MTEHAIPLAEALAPYAQKVADRQALAKQDAEDRCDGEPPYDRPHGYRPGDHTGTGTCCAEYAEEADRG